MRILNQTTKQGFVKPKQLHRQTKTLDRNRTCSGCSFGGASLHCKHALVGRCVKSPRQHVRCVPFVALFEFFFELNSPNSEMTGNSDRILTYTPNRTTDVVRFASQISRLCQHVPFQRIVGDEVIVLTRDAIVDRVLVAHDRTLASHNLLRAIGVCETAEPQNGDRDEGNNEDDHCINDRLFVAN